MMSTGYRKSVYDESVLRRKSDDAAIRRKHDAVLRQIEMWVLYLKGEYPCRPARIKDFL